MSPSFNHAYLQAKLVSILSSLKDYSVFSELTLEIEGKDYVPDVSLFPKQKPDYLHDVVRSKQMPLLAIEIVSPTQAIQEFINKIEIYFQAGIHSCWLVQPFPQAITIVSPKFDTVVITQGNLHDMELKIQVPFEKIFD